MAIQPFFSPFFSLCSSPSLRLNTPWIQSSHLCHQHCVQSPHIPRLILQEPANPRTIMRNISVPIDYMARTIMSDVQCEGIECSHNNSLEMPFSLISSFNLTDFLSTTTTTKTEAVVHNLTPPEYNYSFII